MYQIRGEDRRKWNPSVKLPEGFIDRRCIAERRQPVVSEGSLAEFNDLMKTFAAGDKKSG